MTRHPVCPVEDAIHCVDPSASEPVEILGSGDLRLGSADAPHLDRSIHGSYALYREALEASQAELPLSDLEN